MLYDEMEAAARWGQIPLDYWAIPREDRALMVAFCRLEHFMIVIDEYDRWKRK